MWQVLRYFLIVLCLAGPVTGAVLPHDVYVWQREWSGSVRESIAQHATNFNSFVALAAEVTWKNSQPQVTRVEIDYASLRKSPGPVGLALRIGPFAGPFRSNDAVARFLAETAKSLFADARFNGVNASELQLEIG